MNIPIAPAAQTGSAERAAALALLQLLRGYAGVSG